MVNSLLLSVLYFEYRKRLDLHAKLKKGYSREYNDDVNTFPMEVVNWCTQQPNIVYVIKYMDDKLGLKFEIKVDQRRTWEEITLTLLWDESNEFRDNILKSETMGSKVLVSQLALLRDNESMVVLINPKDSTVVKKLKYEPANRQDKFICQHFEKEYSKKFKNADDEEWARSYVIGLKVSSLATIGRDLYAELKDKFVAFLFNCKGDKGGIDLDGEVPIENQADDKDGSEGLVKEAGDEEKDADKDTEVLELVEEVLAKTEDDDTQGGDGKMKNWIWFRICR
ncbi:hypothetical protein M9H77_17124 [Catharanthus roseus]|uniref:Uncharacterized protein n=1 Tax=Catharanthus roseus TaxID=4058 RepID=A0ACC0B3R0_CATRO|nr:hypothetical protein M9H77_17124 [Catharanthus roseus]